MHDDGAATVWPGEHQPLGATWSEESTNFAVFAPEATAVDLCLFEEHDGTLVETRHRLTEKTLGIWHGAIPHLPVGQRYGFRADGPWAPGRGRRFNPAKLLLDPYARAISGEVTHHDALHAHVRPNRRDDAETRSQKFHTRDERDSAPYVPRSVVVHDPFDWGDDRSPKVRLTDTVVYELHVKGFTKLHDRVPEHLRGTYAGLATPPVVDYLKDLGITTVELLPVHEIVPERHVARLGLTNYWGYNSIGFFAPHHGYSASGDRGGQVTEFKQMVKALHAAGLEVILDVVYNHTAEGGPDGPTLCFRGLDDYGYYKRVQPDQDPYFDVTGCGNTFDTTFPGALRLILDSLRYWVTEMHVDGFRFDLTPALTRDRTAIDLRGSFLSAVAQDPVLRHVKLIAEPWDASMDGYQVGRFPPPWVEWNDRYRDTVRDFWRTSSGGIRDLAYRLSGSSDLYADDGRSPYASVNFVTAHDGFTMRDLVSYDQKHNEPNGERNTDGANHNRSWNCGVEGETVDPGIVALRHRQAANLMVTLCLSAGVPMITAGDERGRTQLGNNNAYSQDNETSWVDWRPDDAWLDLYDITKTALRLRREHPALRQRHFLEGRPAVPGGPKDLAWIHPDGREMAEQDWYDEGLHTLGMFVSGDPLRAPGPRGERLRDASFLIWFHAPPEHGKVVVPVNDWLQVGEVALSTDPFHPTGEKVEAGDVLRVSGRSMIVLRQL
ncbi:glycogen debranching protein GlgX [Nocardioides mesophilus]|uniref:Glycogen debranching protein GlgX n=1 Tax=Nocardioides mesophilus TaxID=433659 RepID=A0A7G9R8U0_9ACTN|nr:glycogen debranching protein GlgX [Nocardioides mesophilus]QNN52015.1 glycogen debranching protein GlgX [Nocardioides mesophilus]